MVNVAIIPARVGSKRIKNKNIRIFCGKPIIYWTIKKIRKSNLFDKIIVSSDSKKILNISKKFGADIVIRRDQKLSNDFAPILPVINDSILRLNSLSINNVCCFHPCNPFLNILDIKKAFTLQKKNKNKFISSVSNYSHPIQRALKLNRFNKINFFFKKNSTKRTQDLKKLFYDAGQFYLANKNVWLKKKNILQNSIAFKIPSWRAIDIDSLDDWKKAELIFKINYKFF